MTLAAPLLGGLGLFLLGTWLMTEGLKQAAGGALRGILESWTRSRPRGLAAGLLITALVGSSSAVTVATLGFVNAGLMSLTQAVWLVFGTNVGTTTTGWLVAILGIKLDIGAYALPLIGTGMAMRVFAGGRRRLAGAGEAMAGFGCFFLGVDILARGFGGLAPGIAALGLPESGVLAVLGFLGLGFLLTLMTQSSSAAIAIALTASAGGSIPLDLAAAAVIGTNVGTTSTALLATIGATAAAKRVAFAHVAFNLLTGVAALLLLKPLVAACAWIAGGEGAAVPTVLAVFHTVFNVLGVLLIWPLAGPLVAWLSRRFADPEDALGRPQHLDATLLAVPELAVQGLLREAGGQVEQATRLAATAIRPAGAAPEPAAFRGVPRLGAAVRGFIGQLSTRPLPADVVRALPDLLRAVQHAEALAADAERLEGSAPAAARLAALAPWEALRTACLEVLQPIGAAGSPEAAEAAYQAVKHALLQATAQGAAPIDLLDAGMEHAQRLRRMALAAAKARRRLARVAAPEPEPLDQWSSESSA
jgi:phosphate:Na+ symporter